VTLTLELDHEEPKAARGNKTAMRPLANLYFGIYYYYSASH